MKKKIEKLYNDEVISIGLNIESVRHGVSIIRVAMKYCDPGLYNRDGAKIELTNVMNGETDWFILPYSYGVAIAKTLYEQYCSGLTGFDKTGIEILKEWLIEEELISIAVSY